MVPPAPARLSHTGPSWAHGLWELQVNHTKLSSKKLVFRLQSQSKPIPRLSQFVPLEFFPIHAFRTWGCQAANLSQEIWGDRHKHRNSSRRVRESRQEIVNYE